MITWEQWVRNASGEDSTRAIASKISVSPSSVSKWFRTNRPPVSAVVAVSRVYGADITIGMVCAGILQVSDIQNDVRNRLRYVPSRLMLEELVRRGEDDADGLNHGLPPEWED